MVNAIARTIPTVNTNLAGFGFGAMYPSWRQIDVPMSDFKGAKRKRCVSHFTLRWLSKKCKVAKNPVGIGKGLGNVGARKAPPSGLGVERRGRSKRVSVKSLPRFPRSRWRLVRRAGGRRPAALVQESPDGCLPVYGAGTRAWQGRPHLASPRAAPWR